MDQKLGSLNTHAIVLIALLAIQYAFGMAANLFVEFPQSATVGQYWEFAKAQPSIDLHLLVGLLLLIGAIALLVRAIRRKDRRWIVFASIGLAAILVAAVSGSTFISTQADAYSYGMSIASMIALIAYGWGLYSQTGRTGFAV